MPRKKLEPSEPTKKREISVVERRLKSGSIFSASSRPIPLTDPDRWTVRIVNTQISNNHLYEVQADKGWVYATIEDLAIKPHEVGFRELDGRIVRGEHAQEVLMKMERADYAAIQKAKDDANRRNTFGSKAVKESIVSAVQREPGGDQGADFLSRSLQTVDVTDSKELVSLED